MRGPPRCRICYHGAVGLFETGAAAGTGKPPLHRVTPLRDDPAAAWLSRNEKLRIDALAWLVWAAFFVTMFVLWLVGRIVLFLFVTPWYSGRASAVIVIGLGIVIFPALRRTILRMKSGRIAELLRRGANDVAADDWEALAREPEGQVASVLGWVRPRMLLEKPVGGNPAIGLALPCQSTYPGVLEAMHDFELCDEEGRTILVEVAGARTFGVANTALDGRDVQMLLASLEVPTGVTASAWHVHALRDGDPVMVVGFKRTAVDPSEASLRQPGERLALASQPPCPLLIFTIDAERRPSS